MSIEVMVHSDMKGTNSGTRDVSEPISYELREQINGAWNDCMEMHPT